METRTAKDEILNALRQHPNILMTIEDVAREAQFSEKTVRTYVDELIDDGDIKAKKIGNTQYYHFEQEIREEDKWYPDKVSEIAGRYEFIKDIRKIGRGKIRKFIANSTPQEALEELIDDYEREIGRLRKVARSREEKERRWTLEKKCYILRNGVRMFGDTFFEKIDRESVDSRSVAMVGSDASMKFEDFLVRVIGIPIILNLFFSVGSAAYLRYEDGRIKEKDLVRRPKQPKTAAEDYLEEMSSQYLGLAPSAQYGLSYSLMNNIHYQLDNDAMSKWESDYHFHDGRLLPGHIDYLDLIREPRAEVTWKSIVYANSVKENAKLLKTTLLGVVKDPMKSYLAEIIDYLLYQEFAGSGWKRGLISNDKHLLNFLMKDGEITTVVRENPYFVYVFDDAHGSLDKRLLNAKAIRRELGERRAESYSSFLREFMYDAFYLKKAESITRYEFFSAEGNLPIRNTSSPVIYEYGISPPSGRIGSPAKKGIEVIPNVLTFAHHEAFKWRENVGNVLKGDIMRRFMNI